MSTEIESLISIYTIDQGKIKILLIKNAGRTKKYMILKAVGILKNGLG